MKSGLNLARTKFLPKVFLTAAAQQGSRQFGVGKAVAGGAAATKEFTKGLGTRAFDAHHWQNGNMGEEGEGRGRAGTE